MSAGNKDFKIADRHKSSSFYERKSKKQLERKDIIRDLLVTTKESDLKSMIKQQLRARNQLIC